MKNSRRYITTVLSPVGGTKHAFAPSFVLALFNLFLGVKSRQAIHGNVHTLVPNFIPTSESQQHGCGGNWMGVNNCGRPQECASLRWLGVQL